MTTVDNGPLSQEETIASIQLSTAGGRVAEEVRDLNLNYSTITGVARDDLPDEGVWLYAETVRQIHQLNPNTGVENLIPDFHAKPELLAEVPAPLQG